MRPWYRLPRDERAALAAGYIGKTVTVVIDPLRRRSDLRAVYHGRLVAVAGPAASGTTSEIVVFTTDTGGVKWAALSVVEGIQEDVK